MNRNRIPRWMNALIDLVADTPMSPIGRLASRRYGTPVVGSVSSTVFEQRSRRVLIAPVNYSGQGYAWARALERHDDDLSARNMAIDVPGGFDYPADLVVPVPTYHNDADWQRRQRDAALGATHVLIEAEEPPFGRLLGRSVLRQTNALSDGGVDVAFLAHGTDVRLPSRHRQDNPWSHYADPAIYAARDEVLAARNIALLKASGRPVFVSTPDLLLDLPDAHWCPVVVDAATWARAREERPPGTPLRVAHAPSVSVIKGTHLILPALERLQSEGIIDLDLIQGVPSREMPARFARADVVIDQLRIGSYGAAACEALASGCLVVGHLSDTVRDRVRRETGLDVPIHEATPDTISDVLRNLAMQHDLRPLRSEGRRFVAEVHDGRRSAAILTTAWIQIPRSTPREDRAGAPPN